MLAYQNGAQVGDISHAGQAVDYERIRQFVLQAIREHEGQETSQKETAGDRTGRIQQKKTREWRLDLTRML